MEFDSKETCNITKDINKMFITCGLKEMYKEKGGCIYMNTHGLYDEHACNWIYCIESIFHCIYVGIIPVGIQNGGEDGEKVLEIICEVHENLGSIDKIDSIYYFKKIENIPKDASCTFSNFF